MLVPYESIEILRITEKERERRKGGGEGASKEENLGAIKQEFNLVRDVTSDEIIRLTAKVVLGNY